MAAPAVRIRVLCLFRMQQSAAAFDQIDDRLIRLQDAFAGVLRQAVAQDAFFVDVAGGVETVLHAGDEILSAVRGRGVDHAGSRIHGDVFGQHAENLAVEKRVLEVQVLEFASGEMRQLARIREIAFFRNVFRQFRRNDVNLAAGLERDVLFIGMKRDRHGRRQRPRGGGPDDG